MFKKLIEKVKAITCILVGHSKIQTVFFGYFYCGRCGQLLGDNLAGSYDISDKVITDCECEVCEYNYKSCTWRDKLFVIYPFKRNGGVE